MDGKATQVVKYDMSEHDLEVDLAEIEKKPWFKDFSICDRAFSTEKATFSTKTKFTYDNDKTTG